MGFSFSKVQTCVLVYRACPWAQRPCPHTCLTSSQVQGCRIGPICWTNCLRLEVWTNLPASLAGRSRWSWRRVRDGIDLAIMEVHALHLFEVEGTGAHPPKDAHLMTAFIHCPVPVETFRNRQGWSMGVIRGNQLWSGTRAKTLIPWGAFRRGELQHPYTITPIGYVDKETRIREAHFHTAGIVDLPIRVVDLIAHRRFGTLNINDHQPLLASGDVRIGAGHINITSFSNRHRR